MAARGPSEQLTFQSGAGSYDPLGLVGCCTVALAVAVVLILIYRAARTRRATGGQHEHTATHTDSWDKSSERTVRRRGRKSASHSQTTGKLKRPLNKIPKPEESTPLECERGELSVTENADSNPNAEVPCEVFPTVPEKCEISETTGHMSECQGKEHPFGENHSNDLKESPAALNNKHKLNSHEKQVSDGDPEKNVNEHKDFKEHLSDYDEQKELAFGLLQDHESNTNKSRRHLRQHQHHHLCDSQESSTDVCKYDVKTENKTDELTARKTGPGMNCKITMENKMKSHVIFPEYSGNHCETVSDQLEKIRDLSNVEKVDKRDKEKTGIVERDIKSHPKETWATETQKNNDTTLNPYQDVFFTGHVSNQSKHLTGCFDQEPDHKAMEVHQQIVNDQSNTKQAVDCTINTPVEENCFTMEINIMEATMNDNEWMNMNSSETENDFLAFNLKDGPDFFGSGTESKCVEDSRSVPKSLDGHVTSKGRATMQPLSQSVKVNFTVHYVTHSPFQLLAVTGSNKELGCWKNFVPLLKVNGGFWSSSIALPVDCQVEWKFVLIEDGKICRWEECCNRHLYTGHDEAISLNKCWGYI